MRAAVAGEPGLTPRRAIVSSAALVALLVLGSAVDAQDSGASTAQRLSSWFAEKVGERRQRVSRNNLPQMNDADGAAVTRQIDGELADLHVRFSLTPLKDRRRTSRTLGASWPRCRRALTRSSLPRADPDADASADRWYAWVTMRRAPGWAVMNGGDQGRILS